MSKGECSSTESNFRAARDIFLSPDERYDVWVVKRVERPELLERTKTEHAHQSDKDKEFKCDQGDSCKTEGEEECVLPLTDGCDLLNWRTHGLAAALSKDSPTRALLNVGYGCTLLRRERQLPIISSGAASQWKELRAKLLEPPLRTAIATHLDKVNETCSKTQFTLHSSSPWFERDNLPAIIHGCTKDWSAMETCTLERLVQRFGDLQWRFSDTHAETMTLSTYYKYIQWEGRLDDAPLAVYDSQFANDERVCLLDEYSVPTCFRSDLFDLLPDDQRPPFRWILIGPARSGTGLHIDPVGTHAWVTLVQGLKRWVLFPYGTDQASISMQDPAIPSAIWFREYYDKVKPEHLDAVEVLQRPGETVYVPAGWPHLVLNLETSVAITHNYATAQPSIERLWQAMVDAEPEMANDLYSRMQCHCPDLAEEIRKFKN
ncbi:hypothetical protein MPSEU_000775500 [Mayamaea pseudoterrestris]|nr:hypothetical protein MPSEU_000775500 [Mayamaea pseudoterrestris]